MSDLLVVGYPKSGNTHMARLLGNAFVSPVTGIGSAHPIAEEGLDRLGPHVVRQLHLMPSYQTHERALVDGWTFAVNAWADERVFWIVRDPRDVAVSMMHYWEIDGILRTLKNMTGECDSVFNMQWIEHIEEWWKVYQSPEAQGKMVKIHYEMLIADPLNELSQAFAVLSLSADNEAIVRSIKKNEFKARKADIERFGDDKYYYPMYHKGIQDKNLRKGVAGDWVNYFDKKAAAYAEEHFGVWMRRFGYTQDENWVEGVT